MFEEAKLETSELGRVISLDRGYPLVVTEQGEFRAEHSVIFHKQKLDKPTVGDWVCVSFPESHDCAVLESVLKRRGCISRAEGPVSRNVTQVLAANIDIVFLVEALSFVPSPYDLAKKAIAAYENDIEPVFVLSKADTVDDSGAVKDTLKLFFPEIEIIQESARTNEGIERIRELVPEGKTAALLGRSGVGKSTLINALVGQELQKEGDVRDRDQAGRHTTVARNLILLDGAGLIIDMPGIRSFVLPHETFDYGLEQLFPQIVEASKNCKFRNCTHTKEPGCAVRESEGIDSEALELYLKLKQ